MNTKHYSIYLVFTLLLSGAVFWGTYSQAHTPPLTVTPAPTPATSTRTQRDIPGGASAASSARAESAAATAHSSDVSLTAGSTSYAMPFAAGASVLDLMRAAAASSSFTFTGHDYPGLGFFVDAIDGVDAAKGSHWFLYVNGVSSETGASQTMLHPGDEVEWRYERDH